MLASRNGDACELMYMNKNKACIICKKLKTDLGLQDCKQICLYSVFN